MRIVLLSTLAHGGAAIAAMNTYRALYDAGHHVSFCTLEPDSPKNIALARKPSPHVAALLQGLFTHWLSLSSPEKIAAGASDLFSDATTCLYCLSPQVTSLIAEADVINLHWVAGIYASPELIAALANKKVVITLHDMNAFTGGCHYHISCTKFKAQCGDCPCLNSAGPDDSSRQTWNLKKEIYRQLNPSIISPSQWLADLSKESSLLANSPTYTAIHCQDLSVFKVWPQEKRMAVRHQEEIPDAHLAIMSGAESVGNSRKNITTLLDALELVSAAGIKFELFLIGNGKRVSPRNFPIRQVGMLKEADLVKYYNMADLFVHPSKLDALTLTLCEAQCCGTPVMSFNAGGTIDTFIPEVTGFLVEEISTSALADKLIQALQDRAKLFAMRSEAHKFAKEKFSPQKFVKAYEDAFRAAAPAQAICASCKDLLQENKKRSLSLLSQAKPSFKQIVRFYLRRIGWLRRLKQFITQKI